MIAEGLRARLRTRRDDEERHAVVDIGSNTVRLVIYGGPPRAPIVLWNEKVSARLGRDLADGGVLPEPAMREALAALKRYALILSAHQVTQIDTVATAAPREASNGAEFLRRVEDLGLPVRVLSGEEEARASAWGAIGAFPGATGVVADLGGGSLELVAVTDGTCGEGATFPLGTLRLPALRASGRFDRKVVKLLKPAGEWARANGPLFMIGGTWRALATYAMRSMDHPLSDPHGFTLSAAEAADVTQQLVRAKPSLLGLQRGISAMRAEKLPDAAALLRVLLKELQPEALIFSSWGIREGLYFRRLSKNERALDPLLEGVASFTGSRNGAGSEPTLLADWTAGIARGTGAGMGSLRLAAAHLAIALHRVEPNLRGSQALEWALDKRWIGIDPSGRAMLAAALRGSLGITEPHPRIVRLASEGELREGTAWGLAFRLAQRLGAGSTALLRTSRMALDGARCELQLTAEHAGLAAGPVDKDLRALAAWLGREPSVTLIS